MPFLDIATTRPVFQNDVCSVNSQILFCDRFKSGKDFRFASLWNSFSLPEKAQNFRGIKLYRGRVMIRAVATLEKGSTKAKKINQDGDDYSSSTKHDIDSGDLVCNVNEGQSKTDEELDERERLRRTRISKANKGNTPWNKGRKHSPETLRKIKERTKIAMQDPKIKAKLVNLGHAQSKETRLKIGVSVRAGWEKRLKMLRVQETCYFEWQNLIAEASRKGLIGEEEWEWDSYEVLDKQLEEEWLQSTEQRKIAQSRPQSNRRGPKTPEQRRKIAEAIAAKWADPDYRNRVCSSLAKYHGTQEGVERKRRRKQSGEGQTRQRSVPKKKVDYPRQQIKRARVKKAYIPKYKDPLASSKLEMLRSIRARRTVVGKDKIEAVKRAKLLIAEAEKAAEALEIAAVTSPVAQASLVETRKLIAEAIQSIETIDMEESFFGDNNLDDSTNDADTKSPLAQTSVLGPDNLVAETTQSVESIDTEERFFDDQMLSSSETDNLDSTNRDTDTRTLDEIDERKINGDVHNFEFTDNSFHSFLNGNGTALLSSTEDYYDLLSSKENPEDLASESGDLEANMVEEEESLPNGAVFDPMPLPKGLTSQTESVDSTESTTATTKRWVRGRLVEGSEEG